MRFLLSALLAATLATPALVTPALARASPGSWRLLNGTGQEAVGLVSTEAGSTARGRNRLRQPLPAGAEKTFRRKADQPCILDIRLRLADGREAVASAHDVCARPVVALEPAAVQPASAAPGRRRGTPPGGRAAPHGAGPGSPP